MPADLEGLLGALREAGVPALASCCRCRATRWACPVRPASTTLALEAGECVLTAGGPAWGAVPEVEVFGSEWEPGHLVTWQLAAGGQARRWPRGRSLGEAERALKEGLLAATAALDRLDVAALAPDAAEQLRTLRQADLPAGALPRGTPPRSLQVLATAGRLRAVLSLAAQDDGAARRPRTRPANAPGRSASSTPSAATPWSPP